MSYCRFSSDNWKSDVYVYESKEGYVIHIASNRFAGDIPSLLSWNDATSDEYFARHKEQIDFVATTQRVAINGAFDGQDFTLATLEELRDLLRSLTAAGYHVPEYVFETIAEEMNEPTPQAGRVAGDAGEAG